MSRVAVDVSTIKIGCQTYTWEMLGDEWQGRVDDILDAVSAAGYAGIEIATPMLREYRDRPEALSEAVAERGLVLASIAHPGESGWTVEAARDTELALAREMIEWLKAAGCGLLGLGGAASAEPTERRREKLDLACSTYDEIGRMAAQQGIRVHLHPHSHGGSIIETPAEYEHLLAATDPAVAWFGPDIGHMMRGGVDYLDFLSRHRDRLLHVHLKDVRDGAWAPVGDGECDVAGLVGLLREIGFEGWLVLEEESEGARRDQRGAIAGNREYLKRFDL